MLWLGLRIGFIQGIVALFRRVLQGFGFVDRYDMSLLLEGHRAPMMLWWLMSEPPSVVAFIPTGIPHLISITGDGLRIRVV